MQERARTDMPAPLAEAAGPAPDSRVTTGGLSLSAAHAINNPLASVIANLDLVAEAMSGEPPDLAARVGVARDALRDARESAERIRALVAHLVAARSPPEAGAQGPGADPGRCEGTTPRRSLRTKVLVVDDDPLIGSTLARSLRSYDVLAIDSAKEALARIVDGERFEVVLCDLLMPGMTGMDLYDEVVRLAPAQARSFVFLSGGAVTARARDFVRSVPNVVLAKPFDVQRLRELVRDRERRPDRVVLVVDDEEDTRKLIGHWLARAKFSCVECGSAEEAVHWLAADPDGADAVVLDVRMPGMDGFDALVRLKANPETAHVPVVILTADAIGESDVARGLDAGAASYLTKPFHGPVLVAQVRAACERSDAERELRMRLDLAEKHATTDGLTGLMNRRAFEGRLAEAVANTGRHREPLALMLLDLDHFKRVNDAFGHAGGDRVLLYFARVLRRAIRAGDQAFRYGGEEFALLLPKCDAEGALRVASRIQRDLRERPVSLAEGKSEVVRFSGGIAAAEAANGFRAEELVGRADAALYRAKEEGRDRVEVGE